jgi:hypothetical protein
MIEGLFDSTARIRRGTAGAPDGYGDVTDAWADVATERCALVPPKRAIGDSGAGMEPVGTMEVYMRAGADLRRGDVLVMLTGPEAGTTWRALDVHRPRGHHTEAALETFVEGAL